MRSETGDLRIGRLAIAIAGLIALAVVVFLIVMWILAATSNPQDCATVAHRC